MPVWANLSGSSFIAGVESIAIRWWAPSLESHAPTVNWNVGVVPTTVPYQSIISCSRVVFRLMWCRIGVALGIPVVPSGGPLRGPHGLVASPQPERNRACRASAQLCYATPKGLEIPEDAYPHLRRGLAPAVL